MKYGTKKIHGKKLLLTNSNEIIIFQKEHTFLIESDKIHFNFNDLISLQDYKELISKNLFKQIKLELNISESVFGYYSSENLKLYANETLNKVYIFSIGESQPSLYKIFIEGCFLKQEIV